MAWALCSRDESEWDLLLWGLAEGIRTTGLKLSSRPLSFTALMCTKNERYFPPAMPTKGNERKICDAYSSQLNTACSYVLFFFLFCFLLVFWHTAGWVEVVAINGLWWLFGRTFKEFGTCKAQHPCVSRQIQSAGQPHRPTQDIIFVLLQERTQPGAWDRQRCIIKECWQDVSITGKRFKVIKMA